MDYIMGLALILISIGLMAVILLQSRGAGLSATFGGDSSVYRSRRGVERRLYQFTIVIAALYALIALIVYLVSEAQVATA